MEPTKDRNSLFSGYYSEFPALLILFPRVKNVKDIECMCTFICGYVTFMWLQCYFSLVEYITHYYVNLKKLSEFVIPVEITREFSTP